MKITAVLRRISKILLFLTALVPIVVLPFGIFPFSFGKVIIFNVLTELALLFFAFSVLADFDTQYSELRSRLINRKWNWVIVAALAYFSSILISTLFSQYHYTAFWGTPDRNEGLFQYLHYVAFIFLVFSSFSKKDFFIYFCGLSASVFALIFGAWLQHLGYGTSFIYKLSPETQPGSYTGNPVYLSSYLTLFFVFTVLLYKFCRAQFEKYKKSVNVFFVLFAILIFATIIITGIKGELVGIVAGTLVFCLYGLFIIKSRTVKMVASSLILIMMIFAGIFVSTRSNSFWQKIPTLNRFASQSIDTSINSRLFAWKAGIKGFLDRPIAGWGHESFEAVFNKYGDPQMSRFGDETFDLPHNKLIEVLVLDGAVGFISYMFLFGFIVYVFRKEPLVLAGLTAYFVQNLFIFDNNLTSILFSVLIAYAALKYSNSVSVHSANHFHENNVSKFRINISKSICLSVVLLVIYSMVFIHGIELKQQYAFGKFLRASTLSDRKSVLDSAIYPLTSLQPRMRMLIVEFLRERGAANNPELLDIVLKSIRASEEAIRFMPFEPRNYISLVEIYGDLALSNNSYFRNVDSIASQGIQVSPNQQRMYSLYSTLLGSQGKFDEAIKIARAGMEVDSGTARGHLYLALAEIASSEKSANPRYNENDSKFAEYRKDGIKELYASYDIASQLNDGPTYKDFSQLEHTQFYRFTLSDFICMSTLFSKIDDSQKARQSAEIGLQFFANLPQLSRFLN